MTSTRKPIRPAIIHQGTVVALRPEVPGGHSGAVNAGEQACAIVKNDAAYVARYTRWLVASTVPTGPAVWSIVAMVPGIHDAFVAVAEPPHGIVTSELLPLALTLNVPVPTVPISHHRVIVTPPDRAAAAACAGLIAITAAMTESSPTHDACIQPLIRSRRPFSTHLGIGFALRTLRNSSWADQEYVGATPVPRPAAVRRRIQRRVWPSKRPPARGDRSSRSRGRHR